jgi:hypothetical protein
MTTSRPHANVVLPREFPPPPSRTSAGLANRLTTKFFSSTFGTPRNATWAELGGTAKMLSRRFC